MSTHNSVLIGEAGGRGAETAANLALRLTEDMPVPAYLIDTSQTKCMFQARDLSPLLEKGHIRMVVNPELWDSPLVSQEVTSLLKDGSICCVFDAGGNTVSTAMLGQFVGLITEKNASYCYVISPCHAFSGGMEDILESLNVILISIRILVEGLRFVANPFMGKYVMPELIMGYIRHLEVELGKTDLELHGPVISERFSGEVRKLTGLPTLELNTFIDELYA